MIKNVKSNEVAIIIPTKDRLIQLEALLNSLEAQREQIGQIIIADGGKNARTIVLKFKQVLPIIYIDCPVKGQIAQRNYALTYVKKNYKLIAYLDDDLQLDKLAFSKILDYYNSFSKKPAGISFNITNLKAQTNSLFRHFFLMPLIPIGKVHRSGYNSPLTNIKISLEVDWLLGGATLWRRDILQNYKLMPVDLSWAVCEDLIFSYPISKHEKLYVCAEAKTLHIDESFDLNLKNALQKSKLGTLRRYEFICQNQDLSKVLFFWMIIGQILGRFSLLFTKPNTEIGHLIGTIFGFLICLRSIFYKN